MIAPRILHISTAKDWRGGEQQIAYLCDELKSRGIPQHVVCIPNSPMQAFCEDQNIEFSIAKKSGGVDFSLSKRIRTVAELFGAQLIHTHDAHGHSAAVLAHRLFGLRVPLVVSRRVDFHVHSAFSKHFKYGHRSIKRFICVSQAVANILSEDLGSSDLVTVVHSGVDLHGITAQSDNRLRRELNLSAETKLVGNVAAHAPHKDLFTFIRTAEHVIAQRKDMHFVSIGDGPQSDDIRAFAKERALGNQFTFLGFRNDVKHILPELDVFLMTSETEGLGTSILDAFAAKVPVVATNTGGIPELVKHGKTGYLAPVRDHESLAKHVLQVVSTNQDSVVGEAERCLQYFSKSATAEGTLKVYREVLSA